MTLQSPYVKKALALFDKYLPDLFIYSVPFVLTGLVIETIRALGYLEKFGLNTLVLMALSITCGFLYFKQKHIRRDERVDHLYLLLRLLTIGIVFFDSVLIIIRIKSGADLINSATTAISTPTLMVMMVYVILLLLLPRFCAWYPLHGIKGTVIFGVFVYLLILQLNPFMGVFIERLVRAKQLFPLNDHDRMAYLWVTAFPLSDVINANTPEHFVILHPPQQFPWPETGNQFVMHRFLYPRTLIDPETWDGTSHIDAVLFDDGGKQAENYMDKRMGWPSDIFPHTKVILATPEKRHLQILGFKVDDQNEYLPTLSEVQPKYTGKVEIHPSDEQISVDAEFSSLESSYLLDEKKISVTPQTTLKLRFAASSPFSVGPVVEFTDSQGTLRYLHFPPNSTRQLDPKVQQEETIELLHIYDRIIDFEHANRNTPLSSYQIRFGIDIAYQRPLPYLYGKGIMIMNNQAPADPATCTDETCLSAIEYDIYHHQFNDAAKLMARIEPLYRGTPRYYYLSYVIQKNIGGATDQALKDNLLLAKRYWTTEDSHNLPLFLLKEMDKAKKQASEQQ